MQSSEDGYTPSTALNSKVSVWHGDITRLEIDAIVCSTFEDLSYASGMSLAVHEAAGPLLINECRQLRWCEVGNAKVAFGYQLPAKCECHCVYIYIMYACRMIILTCVNRLTNAHHCYPFKFAAKRENKTNVCINIRTRTHAHTSGHIHSWSPDQLR